MMAAITSQPCGWDDIAAFTPNDAHKDPQNQQWPVVNGELDHIPTVIPSRLAQHSVAQPVCSEEQITAPTVSGFHCEASNSVDQLRDEIPCLGKDFNSSRASRANLPVRPYDLMVIRNSTNPYCRPFATMLEQSKVPSCLTPLQSQSNENEEGPG